METDNDFCSNPNDNIEVSSSNITSDQIDQETATKLRGDAIGDTMYSEVFVLNTLLQFSDLKWSNEVEDNLCFLWDMTEETDVCKYLFKSSYPSLACGAILKYNEPRFIEIVVGIFANLMCSKDEEKKISKDEIKIVINLLNSDDPYILTQVMRFIHAICFIFDKLEFIEESHIDQFDFILENSTNKELLTATLKTLACMTDSMKINVNVIKGQLLKSAVIAYRTLKEEGASDFETPEQHVNVKHLIQFLCNLCVYIDNLKIITLLDSVRLHLKDFTEEIVPLLAVYKFEDNLLPVEDNFKYYIEALTYIYRMLSVDYISPVAKSLYDIYLLLRRKEPQSLENVAEFLCYFISVADPESIKKDCESSGSVKPVLLHIDSCAYRFDFDHKENLKHLVNLL